MKKRFENIILVSMICMSILPTNVYAKDNREIEKEFTIDVTMAYLCTLGFAYSKVQKQETEHLNSWVA